MIDLIFQRKKSKHCLFKARVDKPSRGDDFLDTALLQQKLHESGKRNKMTKEATEKKRQRNKDQIP